uniref:Uncharacterized protein LOC102805935 n=1 Tax=Saccoglossus kowalevskii TaxID=10224 RepID=A0ABM0MEX4_SACKO|nr:PREDICTED: uncharacterized protein LOC102805935 [Saccoglossus kowalevskii]
MFRFEKDELFRLKSALKIPHKIVGPNKTVATGVEGVCVLLRRLVYPNRLDDLIHIFGRSRSVLSIIFNTVLNHIYDNFGHLLQSLDKYWLQPESLQLFCNAIHERDSPLTNCWGFIDGTARPISRPIHYQKQVFSGHKRIHAMKFQSIIAPNGLIAHMFGPFEGRRHDAAMLAESGLLEQLQQLNAPNGDPYSVYGDPAYPLRPHLLCPFKGALLSPEEREFNKKMS